MSPEPCRSRKQRSASPGRLRVFVWSASDESGLTRIATRYTEHLRRLEVPEDSYVDDLAFTLSDRRSLLPWRSFAIAGSISDILKRLQSGLPKPILSTAERPRIGFIFTGQGANWAQMGKELYMYTAFRESLERTASYFESLGCEWNTIGTIILKILRLSKA